MLKTKELITTGLFVAIIIISSFIKIPLYPVPISLTFTSVNLIVLISSGRISFYSVLIYIIIGLCGLPVFSQGGGAGYVTNVTFGYILGFLCITITGSLIKKTTFLSYKPFLKNIFTGFINIITVYITGLSYAYMILMLYTGETVDVFCFITCYMLIFIPGDVISVLLSSYLAEKIKRTVQNLNSC